ncbi:MAG: Dynamin-like 120 kDa protein, mitochondrial, partial [Paramarteilia canceri]
IKEYISKKLTPRISNLATENFQEKNEVKINEISQIDNIDLSDEIDKEEVQKTIKEMKLEIEKYKKKAENFENQLIMQNQSLESQNQLKPSIKSAINLYSDVIDQITIFNSEFDIEDQMPRVVVVGDQSAGKTSVLEMLIRARIFPRGFGKMMTKAPIQVILSESSEHIAKFKNSSVIYDLRSETHLKQLRQDIMTRMNSQILMDHSVSLVPISLEVKGPGLARMILIDLPGLITVILIKN